MTRREALGVLVGVGASLLLDPSAQALSRLRPVRAFRPRLRAVQLADIHYGYQGPGNPDLEATLQRALAEVTRLRPDVLLVAGDLIEAHPDARVREQRLHAVWDRLLALHLPILAVPGEQDALMDRGGLFRRVVGPLHFHEEVSGVHVFGLDNVSRGYLLGREERHWLQEELRALPDETPVLVMAHAPLAWFYPPWNWYTYDGPEACRLLGRFSHRLLIHGHVHQILRDRTAGVDGLGSPAVSFVYPLPDRAHPTALSPVPMDAYDPDRGLGIRLIQFRDRFHVGETPLRPPLVLGAER